MQESAIDLSQFLDFPLPNKAHALPRLSLGEKGSLYMNKAFFQAVGDVRNFKGKYSPDGHFLLLFPAEKGGIHFSPKGGTAKNRALSAILRDMGYAFPLLYAMEWRQDLNAWVGTCLEMSPPPEFPERGKPRHTRRAGDGV